MMKFTIKDIHAVVTILHKLVLTIYRVLALLGMSSKLSKAV